MAVRSKINPNKFILGIEADGAAYHSSPSAVENDMLRQKILEDKGWKIYRIWSTDWWEDYMSELDKLVSHIRGLDDMEQVEDRV